MTSQELTLLGERITRQGGWRYEERGCPGCRKLCSQKLRSGKLCSQKLRSGKLCSGNFHLRRGEDVARDQWPPDAIRHLQAIRRCRSSPLSGDPRYTCYVFFLLILTIFLLMCRHPLLAHGIFYLFIMLYYIFYFILSFIIIRIRILRDDMIAYDGVSA